MPGSIRIDLSPPGELFFEGVAADLSIVSDTIVFSDHSGKAGIASLNPSGKTTQHKKKMTSEFRVGLFHC